MARQAASWLPYRVFVYGTLRRGGTNHRLLARARHLGDWTTPAVFALFDLGGYPGAVPRGQTAVVGEVYSVDAATLRRLDRLEDYPRLYDRVPVATPWGDAWMYVLRRRPRGARPLPSGDWMNST
jgi:gamma-glutamylcyclotransferase (GGCT)/AIG2-like uncharacterized protein YtfP